MKSIARVPFLLVLSAGLAAQAAAPPVLRIEVRPTRLSAVISHPGEFFGVLIASRSPNTFVDDHGLKILERWDVVAAGQAEGALFLTFPVDANVLLELDAHLQAVVWVDAKPRVASEPISIRKWLDANPLLPELSVDLSWTDVAGRLLFRAVYTAPTDGYALGIAAVSATADGIDVSLKLKTPGPGEGMRDVVETHTAEVDLAAKPGQVLRVFVGETNGIVPIEPFALTRTLVVPPRPPVPPADVVVPASDSVPPGVQMPPSDSVIPPNDSVDPPRAQPPSDSVIPPNDSVDPRRE